MNSLTKKNPLTKNRVLRNLTFYYSVLFKKAPQQEMNNWYEELEVAPDASFEKIKQRYRELLLKYHPDKAIRHTTEKYLSNEKFQQIQKAWEVLGDTEQRKEYDRELKQRQMVGAVSGEASESDFECGVDGLLQKECRCGEFFTVSLSESSILIFICKFEILVIP
jgi:DnaJ-class molecular chaperone